MSYLNNEVKFQAAALGNILMCMLSCRLTTLYKPTFIEEVTAISPGSTVAQW